MKKIVALLLVCLIMCEFFSLCAFAEIPADWNSPPSSPTQSPAASASKDSVAYRADSYDAPETVSADTPTLEGMDSVKEFDVDVIINNLATINADGISRIGYFSNISVFAIVLSNNINTLKVYENFPEDEYTALISASNPYASYWNKVVGKCSCQDYSILLETDNKQTTATSTPTPTPMPKPSLAPKASRAFTDSELKEMAIERILADLKTREDKDGIAYSRSYDLSKTKYQVGKIAWVDASTQDAWYIPVNVVLTNGTRTEGLKYTIIVQNDASWPNPSVHYW